MLNAGTVNIQLDIPVIQHEINNDILNFLKSYITATTEMNKVDSIIKLVENKVLFVPIDHILFITNTLCSISIQVYCDTYTDNSNYSNLFLNLMLHVNRSTTPTRNFISVFSNYNDQHHYSNSLLDIFIHLPSPRKDSNISHWCNNNDILDFLTNDIQIHGMKTTLYNYQKVSIKSV